MKFLIILVLFSVSTGAVKAAVFTNSVAADAFVRAAAPTLNYGAAGALSVSGSSSTNGLGVANGVFDTFIRFNTAAMVADFNAQFGSNRWRINDVTLRVTEVGAASNPLFNWGAGAFEIGWIANDNWIEGPGSPNVPVVTGINYQDESVLLTRGTDRVLGTYTNAAVDAVVRFPLALHEVFVNDLQAGGEVGLFLTALDARLGFTFNSRNFGTVEARPTLEISALPNLGSISIRVSGQDLVIAGENGAAGGQYFLLSSTNLTLPLNQWMEFGSLVLVGGGNFSLTVPNAAGANAQSPQFFIFQAR